MRRVTVGIIGAGIICVALVLTLQAKERKPAAPETAAPEAAVVSDEPIFAFEDDAQMQAFAALWRQRQAALGRLGVLQGYLNQEQAGLQQVDQQLLTQYNLDVTKNYTLDTDRMVLLEQAVAPADAGAVQMDQAPEAPATEAAE